MTEQKLAVNGSIFLACIADQQKIQVGKMSQ